MSNSLPKTTNVNEVHTIVSTMLRNLNHSLYEVPMLSPIEVNQTNWLIR